MATGVAHGLREPHVAIPDAVTSGDLYATSGLLTVAPKRLSLIGVADTGHRVQSTF